MSFCRISYLSKCSQFGISYSKIIENMFYAEILFWMAVQIFRDVLE